MRNGIDTVICADADVVQQVFFRNSVEFWQMDMKGANFQRADAFQQAFFKGPSNAHGFARGFHLGGQGIVGVCEFIKRKTRKLCHHVVQRRLKGSRCVGDLDFVQRHADADFGGDTGDRVAAGFGCEGRRTGDTGIHFNQIILERVGVQGKLHVASAFDFQRPDDLQRAVPQHVILFIGQGLGRADHDGIACVDAHRIQVFHVADGDGGIVFVPYDFVFDFLESPDAFFNQHFPDGGKLQGMFHQGNEFRFTIRKTAAGPAQGKGRTEDDRIADFFCCFQPVLYGACNVGRQHRFPQVFAKLFEQFPVFRLFDGMAAGSKEFRMAFGKDPFLFQLHGQVQARLSADSRQDGIGAFVAYDLGNIFQRQRLHVNLVRDAGIGHDSGRIGITENDFISFFFQGQTGLGSGIIKFSGLPDNDGPGTDDKDLSEVCSFRHGASPLSPSAR